MIAALLVVIAATAAAAANAATTPDGRTVISHGFAGITPRITEGEQVELGLIDTGPEAQRDASQQTFYTPDQVVLQIPVQDTQYPGGEDPGTEIYQSYTKVYDPAQRYWSTPAVVHYNEDESVDWDATAGRLLLSAYVGANSHNTLGKGINAAFRNDFSSPTYSLRALSGPGEFVSYTQPSEFWPLDEGADPLWTDTDHDATWEVSKGGTPYAKLLGTTFTQTGVYCLTFGISVPFSSGTTTTDAAAYTVVVGELPETVPTCEQPPPDEPDDPGPTEVVQYDKGHLDLRAGIKDNELTLGIDSTLVPLERVVLSGTQEGTLSSAWIEGADPWFAGEDGEPIWYFPNSAPDYDPEIADTPTWPGFSTESIAADQVRSTITFTLTGVGGPGDIALFGPGSGQFDPIFSTRLGLPMSEEYGVNAHSHNYWTFTEPGVYCLALTARAQLADGHWSSASGQLTVVAGEDVDPTTVTPCERSGAPAPEQHTYPAPRDLVSGVALYRDGSLRLVPYFESGSLRLAGAHRTEQGGPTDYRDLEDVIFSDAYADGTGWSTSGAPRAGLVPSISASATSLALEQTAVPHVTRLTLGEVRGPGEVSVRFHDGDVIGSAEDAEKEYLIAPQGTTRGQFWTFTQAGVYCVPLTFTVTAAEDDERSVTKVLTAVAGSEAEFPRDAITTCSRGQAPTAPSGEEPPDPQPWQVPNGWVNEAGATVLNDGHVDVASLLEGGSLLTRVKDTTESATAVYRDPEETVLQLLPGAETAVPADPDFAFLGSGGATIWQVSQTQQDDLLWPGWSTESIAAEATTGGIDWRLDAVDGPGAFFIYQTADFGEVRRVLSSTELGAWYTIPKLTHAHGNWAFTAEGVYCLDFMRSATLTEGNASVADSFTLAVVVGKADPRAVDPANCVGTEAPASGDDPGPGSNSGPREDPASPPASPPAAPRQPDIRGKAGSVSVRTRAQTVDVKRYVVLATLSCAKGGAGCTVIAPRRVTSRIAGRRYALSVVVPKTIKPGGKATLRLRLSKVAATRLAGRTASVRVKVVLRAGDKVTTRTIRVAIKGWGASRA